VFRTVSLEDLPAGPATFDTILAVSVNVFWLRASELTGKLVDALAPYGFTTTTLTGTTATGADLLCVVARPA
jgi:hypothetical protein